MPAVDARGALSCACYGVCVIGFPHLVLKGRHTEVNIDVDALRAYLQDYYGTAMMGGFPAAVLDLSDVESMDAYELCEKAEELGVDLRRFAIDDT